MAKLITKEQMAEQESYIMKLKEENMRYAAQNGHAKLALTETYGCQQNENDTERIRGMLRQAGFDFTDDSKKLMLLYIILVRCVKMRSKRFSADSVF